MKLSEIRENPKNPRLIKDENFQKLVRSIQEFPEMLEARPIVVNPDMIVLGGNMRLKACKAAGLTEAPVYVASWEESKANAFIIKDNVGYGEWDWDILANEWDAAELEEWGLDVWQPDEEPTEGLTDPDEVPEAPEEPKTKLGDLYILGDHRLLCGDSTKAEDVEKLMNGEKADAFVTDPPYGIKIGSQSQGKGGGVAKKIDYGKNEWDNEIPKQAILEGMKICEVSVLWGANYYTDILSPSSCWLVWDKDNGETDFADVELAWTNIPKSSRLFKYTWAGMRQEDMKNKEKRVHPTQKPVGLNVWAMEKLKLGNSILDLFCGSGSTLIAAEKTNRKCYGMELDPKYCDVIVKRWEDFTGKKASKQ
jgi:DNA modification methylase